MPDERRLTTADAAALAGITPDSLRRYRVRGVAPEPDGYLGVTPWWHRKTIEQWIKTRPHRGRPTKEQ